MFVSEAGQNLWEEVDIVAKGGNYGWNTKEATHCFDPGNPNNSPAICPNKSLHGEPLIGPVIEYNHNNKSVVVGGYIYHGQALPELEGCYIFADWSSSFAKGDGTLLLARPSDQGLWKTEEIKVVDGSGRVGAYIRSLGQDEKGELYVLTSANAGLKADAGKIFQIMAAN